MKQARWSSIRGTWRIWRGRIWQARGRLSFSRGFLGLSFGVLLGTLSVVAAPLPSTHTITIAVSAPIGAQNPQGYGSNALWAQNLLYEGLTKLDREGNIIPSLAASWRVSPDGRIYTFNLRKDVLFSNGEAFNADAALRNFHSILKNRQAHAWTGLIHALDSVEKLDSHTIALRLKYPYSLTLNELAFVRPFRFLAPSSFPSDLDLVKHSPPPIGTGAYALDHTSPSAITFRKNPYYTDRESGRTPYFDTLVAKIIFDPSAKLSALRTGQVDAIYGQDFITLDIFNAIAQDSRSNLSTYTSSAPIFTTALALNPNRPALESKETRKALMQMLDIDSLISYVYGPLATKASTLYAPNTTLLRALHFPKLPAAPSCEPIRATPPSAPLELIFISNNPPQKLAAEIIQSQAKSCGISLVLKGVEPSAYKNRLINNAFDLAFTQTWGAPYEPLSHLYAMRVKGHIEHELLQNLPQKEAFYKHVAQAVSARTEKSLYENLNLALELLAQAYILLPLAHQRNVALIRSDIQGVEMGALGVELPVAQWHQ